MSNTEGYIYILTNPSFPPYVKLIEGKVFKANTSKADMAVWVDGLKLL